MTRRLSVFLLLGLLAIIWPSLVSTQIKTIPPRPSGQSIVTVYQNGLVTNWSPTGFDPNTTTHVYIDARAKAWQAATQVSNEGNGSDVTGVAVHVHRVGDATVRFRAFENGGFRTGSVEPTWTTDGSTPVDEAAGGRTARWTPSGVWGGAWQAVHAYPIGQIIFAGGSAWSSDGGGNSGAMAPNFAASPNISTTVSDDAITWTNIGPIVGSGVWAGSTLYQFRVDTPAPAGAYGQPIARGSSAVAGTDYVFMMQPTSLFGATGDTEPDWDSAVASDGSTWIDGEIMWVEDTSTQQHLVITGLPAPSGPRLLTIINSALPAGSVASSNPLITLKDHEIAGNDFGAYAQSSAGNRFNFNEADFDLGRYDLAFLAYINGQWQILGSVR